MVGICHGGVCALAVGTSIIETPIENIKNRAITIVVVLFFANFMYFYSPFFDEIKVVISSLINFVPKLLIIEYNSIFIS
jgi:hypothetical protein